MKISFQNRIKSLRPSSSYQFFIFVLHFEPGRDAVSRVQEGLPLGLLHQIVDKIADQIYRDENEEICGQLKKRMEDMKTGSQNLREEMDSAFLAKPFLWHLSEHFYSH